MNPLEPQIRDRGPVWIALSDLFLDTELQSSDLDRIASILANSPYSEHKIEEILRFEVTPLLKWNLMCVAGEWAGFDEEWLCNKLIPVIDRKPFFKFPIFRMIRGEWLVVKERVRLLRNGGNNGTD